MSLNLIRTLLHLAQADGNISGSEKALIYKIAVEKRLPMFEVEQLIQNPPKELQKMTELTPDEKFEYIYTITLMMKMDGILDQRETDMCNQYAVSMGYSDQVVPRLMEIIKSDHELSENKEYLKGEIQNFLK